MGLIPASLNSELRALSKKTPPFDGVACHVVLFNSVTAAIHAAKLRPAALVVIDMDTLPISPEQKGEWKEEKLPVATRDRRLPLVDDDPPVLVLLQEILSQ